MHAIRVSFVVISLFVALRPATAAILWKGDFETADLKQWGKPNFPERVTVVQTPVRDGKYACRVEIRKGDIGASDITRVEMAVTVPSSTKQEGAEIWYAWSALTPEDQPITKGSHQIAYWEGFKVFRQVMSFSVDADNISFATNLPKYQQHWRGKFSPGKWHDFVLRVKWSPDVAIGLVELYFDGKQVVPPKPVQTMYLDPDTGKPLWNFFNRGILRSGTIDPTEVLYLDAGFAATSAADLLAVLGGAPFGTDGGLPVPTDAGARLVTDGRVTPQVRDGGVVDAGSDPSAQGPLPAARATDGSMAGTIDPVVDPDHTADPRGDAGALPSPLDELDKANAGGGCACALGQGVSGGKGGVAVAALALVAMFWVRRKR